MQEECLDNRVKGIKVLQIVKESLVIIGRNFHVFWNALGLDPSSHLTKCFLFKLS